MSKQMTPAQRRKANALIRATCCNYDGGNCIALDDGEECVCVQSISYSLMCRWFLNAVLPADRALYAEIMGQYASAEAPLHAAELHRATGGVRANPDANAPRPARRRVARQARQTDAGKVRRSLAAQAAQCHAAPKGRITAPHFVNRPPAAVQNRKKQSGPALRFQIKLQAPPALSQQKFIAVILSFFSACGKRKHNARLFPSEIVV